ncbi:unnamed protein product [Clavelina lepadiformis]|uniref:Alpha-taxilin n=1 Tax=Clavelina lepadiformis TaxID=159417 RepID=A0ABP0EWV3_CLALP
MEEPLAAVALIESANTAPSSETIAENFSKTPTKVSQDSSPANSPSPPCPGHKYDIPALIGIDGYGSSASASSTPREDSSSGSPSPVPEDGVDKTKSKEKPKVQLGKDLSMMMQALNSLQSPEEKIAALCKKYADLLDQQKILQKQLRLSQRKQSQTQQERDQFQTESNKANSARTKLESLCRELQKRNKAIKEEQRQKSLEEVTLRQEMAAEFQTTLNRLQNQMKTAVDGSKMLQSENERIGGKLNEIVEQYKSRETAMENLVKQHDLEKQLVSAQLKKALLEHQEDKERDAEEKHNLMEQLLERTALYESKLKQEKELRAQLAYYSEKFEDFQGTLEKSNEIFTSFRSEMDKMSKKLKQAEKFRTTMQKKYDDSTKALADTVEYTQQLEVKQVRLEKLSRALQLERNDLAQKLRKYEEDSKKIKGGSSKNQTKKEIQNTSDQAQDATESQEICDESQKENMSPKLDDDVGSEIAEKSHSPEENIQETKPPEKRTQEAHMSCSESGGDSTLDSGCSSQDLSASEEAVSSPSTVAAHENESVQGKHPPQS